MPTRAPMPRFTTPSSAAAIHVVAAHASVLTRPAIVTTGHVRAPAL